MKNNNCVIAARLATSSWSRKAPACRPEPIRQAQGKLRAKHVVEGSIVAILLAMFLTACGDSSGDSKSAAPEVVDPVAITYATEDDLPGCIEKFKGDVALVEKDSVAFKCEDGRWVNKGKYIATEENIKNCTEKREGEVAYIVDEDKSLVCQDGKWVKASDKVPEPAEGTSSSSSVTLSEVEGSSSSIVSSSSWTPEGGIGSSSAQAPSSSSVVPSSSSVASSSSVKFSSSSVKSSSSITSSSSSGIVLPCKTESEDNCEYGILKDSRDGQEYRTVKIGEQWWMAQNLNYAYTGVPFEDGRYTSDSTSWCYADDPANCAKYGRLYTWAAAVGGAEDECGGGHECNLGTGDVQGVCPKGWHLPSKAEWETLIVAVDGSITEYTSSSKAGTKLKSQTGWNAHSLVANEDAFGFSALPAGYRISDEYYYEGILAYIWSSTERNSQRAYRMDLYYANGYARLYDDYKSIGCSVRCVKD